jgi:hypothetical protein
MASIYRNATVTVAAASSNADSQGFLTERSFSGEVEVKGSSSLLGFHRTYDYSTDYWLDDRIRRDPLDTRAWAFQERILSIRYLHYGSHGLSWQCLNSVHCECDDEPIPSGTSAMRLYNTIGTDQDALMSLWTREIVPDFSARALTKSQDILPALSGIASYIGQRIKGRYLAGVWESDLANTLTWQCHFSSNPRL